MEENKDESNSFLSNYLKERRDFPSEVLQQQIANHFQPKTDQEELIHRSRNARRGIVCSVCKTKGYSKYNCPICKRKRLREEEKQNTRQTAFLQSFNEETVEPQEQQQEKEQAGFYWGPVQQNKEEQEKEKVTEEEKNFAYFHYDVPYREKYLNTNGMRDESEVSFYTILCKIQRVLAKELQRILSYSSTSTAFMPPSTSLLSVVKTPSLLAQDPSIIDRMALEDLFPSTVWQEAKDHLIEAKELEERKKQPHKHQYIGYTKKEDDLDSLFKPKAAPSTSSSTSSLFRSSSSSSFSQKQQNKKQPFSTLHSLVPWKQPTAKFDQHAQSNPQKFLEQQALQERMAKNGDWVHFQENALMLRVNALQHMEQEVTEALAAERRREKEYWRKAVEGQQRDATVQGVRKRGEDADRLMRLMEGYGFLGGVEEADYLLSLLKQKGSCRLHTNRKLVQRRKIKEKEEKEEKEEERNAPSLSPSRLFTYGAVASINTQTPSKATNNNKKKKKKKKKKIRKKQVVSHMPAKYKQSYRDHKRKTNAFKEVDLEARIRKGKHEDTTFLPSVIPLLPTLEKKQRKDSSYLANSISEDIVTSVIDPVSGYKPYFSHTHMLFERFSEQVTKTLSPSLPHLSHAYEDGRVSMVTQRAMNAFYDKEASKTRKKKSKKREYT